MTAEPSLTTGCLPAMHNPRRSRGRRSFRRRL